MPSLLTYWDTLRGAIGMAIFSLRFQVQMFRLDLEPFMMNVQIQMRKRAHVDV
jgi:lipid-A-disaccharide synthase-like uncharacterized protein